MKPDEREKYKGNDAEIVHVLPLSRTASWMTQAPTWTGPSGVPAYRRDAFSRHCSPLV